MIAVFDFPVFRLDASHGGTARGQIEQGQLCHPVSAEISGGRSQLRTVLVLPWQVRCTNTHHLFGANWEEEECSVFFFYLFIFIFAMLVAQLDSLCLLQVLLKYWEGPGRLHLLSAIHRQIRGQCRYLVLYRVRSHSS